MKLLTNKIYKSIEDILKSYYLQNIDDNISKAIQSLIQFFEDKPHKYFLEHYYFKRHEYKNRYPTNSLLLRKICKDLYIEEPTGYVIRKELIYKAAMIFYKEGVLK